MIDGCAHTTWVDMSLPELARGSEHLVLFDDQTSEVDQFLVEAGAVAVRQKCWLWKKADVDPESEIWIGDARSDNFVLAEEGIIPIDIQIWGVPIQTESS